MTFSWRDAARELGKLVDQEAGCPHDEQRLDAGQRDSVTWIADRLPHRGLVLADEVGTGKTRIACAVVHAVRQAGGRAAVVVPHGLMHQWAAESRRLSALAPAPKTLTTCLEFLREQAQTKASWKKNSPLPQQPEWWLISHGFRAPIVRSNSAPWRVSLPSLVQLYLSSRKKRGDGRTRLGKLQRKVESEAATEWALRGMARLAEDVAPHVRSDHALRKRLAALPLLKADSAENDALLAHFAEESEGRLLTEDLLGLWLGQFDLIVIDEAHKSRGEADDGRETGGLFTDTVLARLVDRILKQPTHGRRLCLTATPMELDLSQWMDLIRRASGGLDMEHGRSVAQRLRDAARLAAIAPDEPHRLEALCAASHAFTQVLAPFVTRRRRSEDDLIARFRAAVRERDGLPHPHRRIQRVPVEWTVSADADSPWFKVLFAAECMSHSARGLRHSDTAGWPRSIRGTYLRLAAGHVSLDTLKSGGSIPMAPPDNADPDTGAAAKVRRTAYWHRELRQCQQRAAAQLSHGNGPARDADAEHPRILSAVKEIERWTHPLALPSNPHPRGHKVLVFGVFLRPLRVLRDVLEVRHWLRSADTGQPVARALHQGKALFDLSVQQVERLRNEGLLTGALARGDSAGIGRALEKGHNYYLRLRRKVRRRAEQLVDRRASEPSLLGGVDIRALRGHLVDHLVSFLVDELMSTRQVQPDVADVDWARLGDEFFERLRPLLLERHEDGEEDPRGDHHGAIRTLLEDEGTVSSHHARLLQGSTHWMTRRYVQAAFNRPHASPQVLIAQSQVGREGLNLHEACRVVVQFHAEWNPAVLEQQIGRVDRKGSLWEKLAEAWLNGDRAGDPPFIEVRQLVFDGTYDAFQWDRVAGRQQVFDASLFGALVPEDAWQRIPDEWQSKLRAAAPSFRPTRKEDG